MKSICFKYFLNLMLIPGVCFPMHLHAGCRHTLGRFVSPESAWKMINPWYLKTPNGEQKPITLSFDAELWDIVDIFKIVASHEPTKEKMRKVLHEKGLSYTPDELKILFKLKHPDSLQKVLLKSAQPKEGRYVLSDVKIPYLFRIDTTSEMKTRYADATHALVNEALRGQGLAVGAKLEIWSGPNDDHAVELIQDGAITLPFQFDGLITGFLYKKTHYPQTHFHVGIPSESVSLKQAMLLARAVELKLALDELFTEQEYGYSFYPYDHSAIASRVDSKRGVFRGLVRLTPERWKKPYPAHDFEIRNWMNVDHAKELMWFLARLAKDAPQLIDTSDFQGTKVRKIMPANLNASLRYLARLLEGRHGTEELRAKLISHAKRIEKEKTLTEKLRNEIRHDLLERKVYKLITPDLFLVGQDE